jgi:hypothetical protein
VRCPTTYGVRQPPPELPSHVSVEASPSATSSLSAYSNGPLILLAPRGWHCHAIIGADGGASMTVAAGSTTKPAQPAVTVNFADTPGPSASLACSLFASAARQLPHGVTCPVRKPRKESTSNVNKSTIDFTDPPRVHGDGRPSGGSDPAAGAIVFEPVSDGFSGYAFTVTCTLSAKKASICRTILADELTRVPESEQ